MDLLGCCVWIQTDICIIGRRLATSRGERCLSPIALAGKQPGPDARRADPFRSIDMAARPSLAAAGVSWLRVGAWGQFNAEPAAGNLSSLPAHRKRASHGTVPCAISSAGNADGLVMLRQAVSIRAGKSNVAVAQVARHDAPGPASWRHRSPQADGPNRLRSAACAI
jgi:hypothetical protein